MPSCLVSPRISCSWAPTSNTREREGEDPAGVWSPQLDWQIAFPDVQHFPGEMKTSLFPALGERSTGVPWASSAGAPTPFLPLGFPAPTTPRRDHLPGLACTLLKSRHHLF